MMDPVTTSVGIGLVVCLLFTEAFGLAAGGMIVPGYVALHLHRPLDVVATLAVAGAAWGLVRGISRFAIVYGRRRIVLMVLAGFVLGHAARSWLLPAADPISADGGLAAAALVIGYIVPGLIALWFDRQGVWNTLGTVLTASAVVRLGLVVLGMEVHA